MAWVYPEGALTVDVVIRRTPLVRLLQASAQMTLLLVICNMACL